MKKKLFAIPMAVLAMAGLASCDNQAKEVETEKVAINVWATAAEEAVITKLVKSYNDTHENDFTVNFTAVSESDCGTTLGKDPTVKDAPALFLCADDQIASLTTKNSVSEIKNARKDAVVANNSDVAVQGAMVEDKLYGYPVTSDNGYFLWYNKSLVSDTEVQTLEGILSKASTTNKKFFMDVANGWYANSFIMSPQACGSTSLTWSFNADKKAVYESTWDSEKGAKVSEYITSILKPAYDAGNVTTGGNEIMIGGFKDKSIIAGVSGTWMENDLINAIGADNLAAVKLPTYTVDGTAYQMASFTGSKVYCINKTRPVEEQVTAATLAELLTSKEGQLVRFEERNSLPCNKEAAKDARYTENVSIGAAALLSQNQFACVQSKTAEDRYWDIGKAIGQTYLDNLVVDASGNSLTWQQFLKGKMDTLRQPLA